MDEFDRDVFITGAQEREQEHGEPDFEVLIPVYNYKQLRKELAILATAIDPIIDVGYTARFTIYDDGSDAPALSPDELASWEHSIQLSYHRNACNLGRGFARQQLLEKRSGRLIVWHDAGDDWLPGKTQAIAELLSNPESCTNKLIHYYPFIRSWGGNEKYVTPKNVTTSLEHDLLRGQLEAYLWTCIFHTSVFNTCSFDPKLRRLQDLDIFIQFAKKNYMVCIHQNSAPTVRYNKTDSEVNYRELRTSIQAIYSKHKYYLQGFPRAQRLVWDRHNTRLLRRVSGAKNKSLRTNSLLLREMLNIFALRTNRVME